MEQSAYNVEIESGWTVFIALKKLYASAPRSLPIIILYGLKLKYASIRSWVVTFALLFLPFDASKCILLGCYGNNTSLASSTVINRSFSGILTSAAFCKSCFTCSCNTANYNIFFT